jgi:arylsulfatase A-like enzyme
LQSDYIIKEIFLKLAKDGVLNNSTIFIVADHGELFGEDGKWSHGGDLHEKLLEIPLLVYDKQKQIKDTEGASLLDIAPTIAERIGYPSPACWQGHSLFDSSKNFVFNVFSNDENIQNPYGNIEKEDSVYTFHVFDKKHNLVLTKQKTNGIWKKVNNELFKKNN